MPIKAIPRPPAAGPTMPAPVHTLPRYEAPDEACSIGITCASNALRAGRSNPAATPTRKTTARINGSPTRAGARRGDGEHDRARDEDHTRDEDDRASVAAVGDVPADEHQPERWDGFHEAEQAQREGLARHLVGLEGDDGRQGRHPDRVGEATGEERPELGQAQDARRPRSGHVPRIREPRFTGIRRTSHTTARPPCGTPRRPRPGIRGGARRSRTPGPRREGGCRRGTPHPGRRRRA